MLEVQCMLSVGPHVAMHSPLVRDDLKTFLQMGDYDLWTWSKISYGCQEISVSALPEARCGSIPAQFLISLKISHTQRQLLTNHICISYCE